MKAIVYEEYGAPDVIELREVEKPVPADDELLVRVRAASVNPVDWHMLIGMPYLVRLVAGLRRPKDTRLGSDFAGIVESVGSNVTQFRPGDEVFGIGDGALAEYVCVREGRAVVRKPENVTFEEAGAVGVAALTALQGLRDKGHLEQGQRVLINGASGGVGTFAVQIAKSFGADVAGVCSTQNVEKARALGADRVIDYTRADFTKNGHRYDVMLDIGGTRSWRECKRALDDTGILVAVGGPKTNRLVGPLGRRLGQRLLSILGSRKAVFFIAKPEKADLLALSELLETGKVKPFVERTYDLGDAADAFRYLGTGHAQGKLVVTV